VKIPLRLPPGAVPTFTEQDIILETGDTILIEGRGTEVFYTGGLLGVVSILYRATTIWMFSKRSPSLGAGVRQAT